MKKKDILVALGGIIVGVAGAKIGKKIYSAITTDEELEDVKIVENGNETTTYNYHVTFKDDSALFLTTSVRLEKKIVDKIGNITVDDKICQRVIDMLSSYHILPESFRYYSAKEMAA